MGRSEEAIAAYDELVEACGEADALRAKLATALANKSSRLDDLGRFDEALAVAEEVVARFGADADPTVQKQVARALLNAGATLAQLGRWDAAVAASDALVARFEGSSDPSLLPCVAEAMLAKTARLAVLKRHPETISLCDAVAARFGGLPAFRTTVAQALFVKARVLDELRQSDDASAVYGQLIALLRDADDAAMREILAESLLAQGQAIADQGRHADAVALFGELVARFHRNRLLAACVAQALVDKGASLRVLKRPDEARAAFTAALDYAADEDWRARIEAMAKA
jgi:tetratricopeptide (TPR) repeat protein